MNTLTNNLNHTTENKFGKLWSLLVLIFIDSLNYFLVIPVFRRLFSRHYSLLPKTMPVSTRDLLFGVAVLLSSVAFLIFSPVVGHLSDRFGRKKILIGCLFASFFGYLLPILGIYTNSLALILLGRLLAGASTGSQPIAQAAVADITSGKQKAIYLALIGFSMTFAMIIGPVSGAILSNKNLFSCFSVATPYWVGAILSLFNIILLMIFFHETYNPAPQQGNQPRLITALRQPVILYLLLIFSLMEFAWSLYYQVLFIQMPKAFNYSIDQVGFFMCYLGVWMSIGLTFVFRIFISNMRMRPFVIFSLCVTAVGYLGMSFIHQIIAFWLFVILVAIFTGTAYASILTLISNATDKNHQGLVLGFSSTLLGFVWSLTAFIGALLIRVSLQFPFYVATMCMATAILLMCTRTKEMIA